MPMQTVQAAPSFEYAIEPKMIDIKTGSPVPAIKNGVWAFVVDFDNASAALRMSR